VDASAEADLSQLGFAWLQGSGGEGEDVDVREVGGSVRVEGLGVVEVFTALFADGVGGTVGQAGAEAHLEALARLDGARGAGFELAGPTDALPLGFGYTLEVLAELYVDVLGGCFEVFEIKRVKVHHDFASDEVACWSKEGRERW
jgi:hypothetical protein